MEKRLRRWMRAVGAFYLLLSVFNTPWIIEQRLPSQYPNLGVPVGSNAAQAVIDTWFMFGLDLLVIGLALLYFSRNPLRHVALVWTVMGLEFVRGVLDDIYLITVRGETPLAYAIWIPIHLTVIATGIWALQQRASAPQTATSASVGG